MPVGISAPLPAYTIDPASMASTAERLGFDSIWYAEHPAVPVKSDSPFPATGGEIPWTYSHFTEPNRITPAELEKSRRELDRLAEAAGRDPKSITISVYGQEPDRALTRSLFDAGADRVVIRPKHVETEAEMSSQLERIAAEVL